MTSEELQAIRARAEKATPGPWTLHTQLGIDDPNSPDTDFIIHAREDIHALLHEVARLRAALSRIAKFANPYGTSDEAMIAQAALETTS